MRLSSITRIRTLISSRPANVPLGCCCESCAKKSDRSRLRVAIPALVRGDELITASGVFGRIVGQARRIEAEFRRLVGGHVHRQSLHRRARSGQRQRCRYRRRCRNAPAAKPLRWPRQFWEHRERCKPDLRAWQKALHLANATRGTVVLVDAADATSSGASGDCNAILRELLAAAIAARRCSHRRCGCRP